MNAKDKMNKKNKHGAAFTDDGFAMGKAISHLLCVTDAERFGVQSLSSSSLMFIDPNFTYSFVKLAYSWNIL